MSWRRLSAGAVGGVGVTDDALGRVSYQRIHGFVSYDLMHAALGRWRWAAGPRAGLGGTFASATPTQAASADNVVTPSAELAAETALALILGSAWLAKLRFELGFGAGTKFRADDRDLASFAGPFFGTSLGVVAALGRER